MNILDCEQGSREWIEARIGIPTASHIASICPPKSRKMGRGADTYLYQLLAEWIIGEALDAGVSDFMERGIHMEQDAVKFYELQRDVETRKVGFIESDCGLVGCSPDRLVGDDGGLEIKCPSAHVHVQTLLTTIDKYGPQCQCSMYVTGREWWDILSYHPTMPSAIVRLERDEEYIEAMVRNLKTFHQRYAEARDKLKQMGVEGERELIDPLASALAASTEGA